MGSHTSKSGGGADNASQNNLRNASKAPDAIEAVAREYQAARSARQVEQRYGKDAKARTRNAKSLASIKNSDIDKMNKSQLKSEARKASVFSVGKYLGAPKTEAEALRRADALLSGASITDLKNAIKRGRKYAKDFIEE